MTKASKVVFVFFIIFMGVCAVSTLERMAHSGQLGRVGDCPFLSHTGYQLSASFCPVTVTCNPTKVGVQWRRYGSPRTALLNIDRCEFMAC